MTQDRAAEIAKLADEALAYYPPSQRGSQSYFKTYGRVIAALTAAREEGKREGMELAADVAAGWSAQLAVQELAKRIRSLIAKEKAE